MPITATCGGCGNSVTVPDTYAGRTGKCKRCGLPIAIPRPDVGFDEPIMLEAAAPDSSFVTPTIQVTGDDDDIPIAAPPSAPMFTPFNVPMLTRESWYYRFLVIYAYAMIIGGGVIWLVWTIFAMVVGRSANQAQSAAFERMARDGDSIMSQPSGGLGLMAFIILLIPPTLVLLGTITAGSVILLGVDAARNLRVIRLQGHFKG